MAKILVTGAKGYIGRSFIQSCDSTHEIVPIRLQTTPIDAIHFDGVEAVLHLSALVHQTKARPAADYEAINVTQTVQLARKAKAEGVKHFIFMSSVSVYGTNGQLDTPLVLNETSPCRPTSFYGQSKLKAETLLSSLSDEHFTISIVRAPMVYGPHAPGNMQRLIKLIRLCPVLPFKSDNLRSMIYIDNLMYFLHQIIKIKPSGILLCQDKEPLTLFEIATIITQSFHVRRQFIPMPRSLRNILYRLFPNIIESLFGHFLLDSTLTNEKLGTTPPVKSTDALKHIC